MFNLNDELKNSIKNLNISLNNKYRNLLDLDRDKLRYFIENKVGPIKKIEKLNQLELANLANNGGLLCVDGSSNKLGGSSPHYLELYQGLAKSSVYKAKGIFKIDIFSPLISEYDKKLEEESIRRKKLANIEVEAALEGIKAYKPSCIMMDGSLIRYSIEAQEKYLELRDICLEEDIILIGLIEDIKTSTIGRELLESDLIKTNDIYYDKELLYNILDYGEIILVKDTISKKAKEGLSSLFMRSSSTPIVIGMDILDSQVNHIEEMGRLVLSLTPINSRGIPLFLDIIDKEVRITDKIMKSLLETYLDRDIYEKFFVPIRDKRMI